MKQNHRTLVSAAACRVFLRRHARLAGGSALLAVVLCAGWAERRDLADQAVGMALQRLKIPGQYHVSRIGLTQQVLDHVVIGNAAHPDFRVERIIITTGIAGIEAITLYHPRLSATYHKGALSFGSLDTLFKGPSTSQAQLPSWMLRLIDARVSISTDAGPIGLASSGAGVLRDGFLGVAALSAPALSQGGCTGNGLNFLGPVHTSAGKPILTGTAVSSKIVCANGTITAPRLALDARISPSLNAGVLRLGFSTGWINNARIVASAAQANALINFAPHLVVGKFHLAPSGIIGQGVAANALWINGHFRMNRTSQRLEADGNLGGNGLTPTQGTLGAIRQAHNKATATFAAPLIGQMLDCLKSTTASQLSGNWLLRTGTHGNGSTVLLVPEAHITDADGRALVSLSHASISANGLTASLRTGAGLPPISAQITQTLRQRLYAHLVMSRWQAGTARLAIPTFDLSFGSGGATLTGRLQASGDVPGGSITDAELRLDGDWSRTGGWRLGLGCVPLRFAQLHLGSLALGSNQIKLCSDGARAILVAREHGTHFAMRLSATRLTGIFQGQPLAFSGAALALSSTGLKARDVQLDLGNASTTSHFALGTMAARFGSGGVTTGSFDGAVVKLAPVPLDVGAASGNWRWANGQLHIDGGAFRVSDREEQARFEPLIASGAVLTLINGTLNANALLHDPKSGRALTWITLTHDLNKAQGSMQFSLDHLTFDKDFRLTNLTPLTLGLIADARGAVSGSGSIGWVGGHLTSTAQFSTDGFDFAAPFGPVKGVSGTVVFTDLLGLITAPDQQWHIASINPGIEVKNGTITYDLQPGYVLSLHGGEWPFLDGSLRLMPTSMVLGADEIRHYVIKVDNIDAAKFLAHMEISNLSATGSFDGTLPLVFHGSDGQIVGGQIIARAPGGTVSYIGALTWKNLSPFANYAFRMLRSLRYHNMVLGVNGSLDGEIITSVAMSGVRQGPGASRNLISRQIADLPIVFNVNIRAPFYQLIGSYKSMSDPKLLANPLSLGLIDHQGKPLDSSPPITPANSRSPHSIQPLVSETKP